ncbi:MAG: MOSC domain-containing protein [Bryobacter sp.]|nr:MOSC domain-containing protein [Bryobacter sp.]
MSERGLAGDDWAHPKYHGGPKQALLLISREHLDELCQLGFSLAPGDLGENLTISGLDWELLEAGTELQIGENCRIVLTKLREPCRTLDVYNGAKQGRIQPLLKKNARGGWYAQVLMGGVVRPGDTIRVSERLGK